MASSLLYLVANNKRKEKFMIVDVQFKNTRGHWEVFIYGEFFCSADSYTEAVNELHELAERFERREV